MKKTYLKPTVEVECFCLTQHIASCSGIKINSTSTSCVLSDPDAVGTPLYDLARQGTFMDAAGCLSAPKDSGVNSDDGICYFSSAIMAFPS